MSDFLQDASLDATARFQSRTDERLKRNEGMVMAMVRARGWSQLSVVSGLPGKKRPVARPTQRPLEGHDKARAETHAEPSMKHVLFCSILPALCSSSVLLFVTFLSFFALALIVPFLPDVLLSLDIDSVH